MMDQVDYDRSPQAQPARRLSLVEIADIQYVRMKAGIRMARPKTELDLSPSERRWLDEARDVVNRCDA